MEGNIKLQFRYALLTYKTHIKKDILADFIQNIYPTSKLSIAHEISDTGYEHTHVVMDIGQRTTVRNIRKFDINEIHCNIKSLHNHKAYKDAIKYISKQDKEISLAVGECKEEEIDDRLFCHKIWDCETLQHAMELYINKPSDCAGIVSIYMRRPLKYKKQDFPALYDWQLYISNLIFTSNSDRHIYWLYDLQGNSGKTLLAKYMEYKDEHNVLYIERVDNIRDMANIFLMSLQNGNSLNRIIIDLPRSTILTNEFYVFLESIKNGKITSTKYQGGTLTFDNKCLIVFSNIQASIHMWSKDRLISMDIESIKNKVDKLEEEKKTDIIIYDNVMLNDDIDKIDYFM